MAEGIWTVAVSADVEHHALYEAAIAAYPAERVDVISDGSDDDRITVLFLRIPADDQDGARAEASRVAARLADRLDVTASRFRVAGATAPPFDREPWRRLLAEAHRLADDHRYEAAVIWAQTAAEVFARSALTQMFAARLPSAARKRAHRLVRLTLRDDRSQDVVQAVFGSRPSDEDWWNEYKTHVDRRHVIVHEGFAATRADAESSLAAVEAFITWLQGVWSRDFPGAE